MSHFQGSRKEINSIRIDDDAQIDFTDTDIEANEVITDDMSAEDFLAELEKLPVPPSLILQRNPQLELLDNAKHSLRHPERNPLLEEDFQRNNRIPEEQTLIEANVDVAINAEQEQKQQSESEQEDMNTKTNRDEGESGNSSSPLLSWHSDFEQLSFDFDDSSMFDSLSTVSHLSASFQSSSNKEETDHDLDSGSHYESCMSDLDTEPAYLDREHGYVSSEIDYLVFPRHSPECQCNQFCSTAREDDLTDELEEQHPVDEVDQSSEEEEEGDMDELGIAAVVVMVTIAMLWWLNLAHGAH